MDPTLPEGWHISSRLMAALKFSDGSTIEVSTGGYFVTDDTGTVLAKGTDFRPSPLCDDWPDVLCAFIGFLEHDAEVYQHYMGPVPEHHDSYLFGDKGAEWAYMHRQELSEARYDMDPEGVR